MSKLKTIAAVLGVAAMVTGTAQAQDAELWHFFSSGSEAAGLDALVKYANGANADAPITPRVFPGNIVEMRRAIETSLMGGSPPAAYDSGMGFELKTFADGGHLRPLSDVWARIQGDKIFPEGVQRVAKVNGVPMGIPFDVSLINNIFYNKAIFAKYAIEVPTDWTSLVAACTKLRAAGVQPLGNAGGPFWSLYTFYPSLIDVFGVKGYYAIADGSQGFDTPEFRAALDRFRTSMVACYAKDWSGKSWTQTADDLINGQVAMDMMGMWAAGYMKKAGFEPNVGFDFFPAPSTGNLAIFQMDLFAVPQGPDAITTVGVKFAEAAASAKGQAAFTVVKGSLAPNIEVDPTIYDYAGRKAAKELKAAKDVLPNLFFLLPTKLGTELGNQIERFAIDPSKQTEDDVVSTLESLRTELVAEKAFVKW